MRDLRGNVAVVTGAGSPLGSALSRRFGAEGMRVVVADTDSEQLRAVAAALHGMGTEVLAVHADVTRPEQMDDLARQALARFGSVHVVCNNAGAITGALSWNEPEGDWEWMVRVNLLGVLHSIRTFVPRLIAQPAGGHVINVTSIAGLVSFPYFGVYSATQHAVVALSEALALELSTASSHVRVSVLCTGLTATDLDAAERARPLAYTPSSGPSVPAAQRIIADRLRAHTAEGLSPDAVAARCVEGSRRGDFCILAHPEHSALARRRLERLLSGALPELELPDSGLNRRG